MNTQTKTFDGLLLEFPALDPKQGRALKGGSGPTPGYFNNYGRFVSLATGGSSTGPTYGGILLNTVNVYGQLLSPFDVANSGYSGTNPWYGGGGGSAGGWNGSFGETFGTLNDSASLAVSLVQGYHEFSVKVGQALGGTLKTDFASIKNELLQSPLKALLDNSGLKAEGLFKGIAIVDTLGKVLGVAGALEGASKVYADLKDNGRIDRPWDLVDAAVSIGSLAIKSNILGFAVSTGWLLIKGEFEPK